MKSNRREFLLASAASFLPTAYGAETEIRIGVIGIGSRGSVLLKSSLQQPQDEHGIQAVAAMRAGKHVASETPAAYSLEQLWELVETKEKTGKRYMLLENYIYSRPHMQVLNMVRQGVFGDVTYGECGYVHDTRSLAYDKGQLAWRGRVARDHRGDLYPTHGLGPMAT
jgi:hypothetical protein